MFETLISKVQTTLNACTKVQQVFMYPEKNYTKFPAVCAYPSNFENSFETTDENMKMYRFSIWVMIAATKQKGLNDIFTTVMPKTLDNIIATFDEQWDQGVSADGKRIWQLINFGVTGTDQYQDGQVAYTELELLIKVLTTN